MKGKELLHAIGEADLSYIEEAQADAEARLRAVKLQKKRRRSTVLSLAAAGVLLAAGAGIVFGGLGRKAGDMSAKEAATSTAAYTMKKAKADEILSEDRGEEEAEKEGEVPEAVEASGKYRSVAASAYEKGTAYPEGTGTEDLAPDSAFSNSPDFIFAELLPDPENAGTRLLTVTLDEKLIPEELPRAVVCLKLRAGDRGTVIRGKKSEIMDASGGTADSEALDITSKDGVLPNCFIQLTENAVTALTFEVVPPSEKALSSEDLSVTITFTGALEERNFVVEIQ